MKIHDRNTTFANASREWQSAAQSYLRRLGMLEYQSGLAYHVKTRRRSPNTYHHNPSQYHRDLVALLGNNYENGFKALKVEQGYVSILGL